MLSDQTLAFGEKVITALLGVDALYRHESGDAEGLAVLNMSAGRHAPEGFSGYAAARQRVTALRKEAEGLPEADRRRYYDQLCHSTLAFVQWRQQGLPFTEQLASFLHVPAEPASEAVLNELRGSMRDLLNALGYSGDLRAQFAAWEAKNRVPADEVPGLLNELLETAWDRTEERLHIPAEKSDGMKVVPVMGAAFNARCDYLHRQIELNVDPVLTRQGLNTSPSTKRIRVTTCSSSCGRPGTRKVRPRRMACSQWSTQPALQLSRGLRTTAWLCWNGMKAMTTVCNLY